MSEIPEHVVVWLRKDRYGNYFPLRVAEDRSQWDGSTFIEGDTIHAYSLIDIEETLPDKAGNNLKEEE